MSDARKPKWKEPTEDGLHPKLEDAPDQLLTPEQLYLKRKAEVTRQDNEAFSEYLQQKSARDQQQKLQFADPPPRKPFKLNRRSVLTWAAGTAVVGEAATL